MRISYFDIVGKALGSIDRKAVAQAIEELSATYRELRHDFAYGSAARRAAYLWHLLPAHVCDLARLFADVPGLLTDRERLAVVALGAGPGTEVLALLEAVSAAKARGELEELREVRVTRVDRVGDWDASFARLLEPALEQAAHRDPSLDRSPEGGDPPAPGRWRLEAPPGSLVADLARGGLPEAVREAVAGADAVVAANLLSEVPPRGDLALPPGLRESLAAIYAALAPARVEAGSAPVEGGAPPAGATAEPRPKQVLLVDRAGAPGAGARLAEAAELARAAGPEARVGPVAHRRARCGCALSREARALYRRVRLPTTQEEDRPVRNCKTAWTLAEVGP